MFSSGFDLIDLYAFFNRFSLYIEYMSRVYSANYLERTRRTNRERPLDGALYMETHFYFNTKQGTLRPLWRLVNYFAEHTSVNCAPLPSKKECSLITLQSSNQSRTARGLYDSIIYYNGSQNSTIFLSYLFLKATYSKEPKIVTSFN